MELTERKSDKDVFYTLRCAHQKQAQLILLAVQKAQILSGLVLVVLTSLGTRLIYMLLNIRSLKMTNWKIISTIILSHRVYRA